MIVDSFFAESSTPGGIHRVPITDLGIIYVVKLEFTVGTRHGSFQEEEMNKFRRTSLSSAILHHFSITIKIIDNSG